MTSNQLDIFRQDFIGLSVEEAAVWEIVRSHPGRESAIRVDTLAFQTRLDEKVVRETVSRLVVKHGKLIASSTGNPPGFYVITDKKELEAHIRSLRHRGIACLIRAAALSKSSVEDIFNQGRLDMKGGQG